MHAPMTHCAGAVAAGIKSAGQKTRWLQIRMRFWPRPLLEGGIIEQGLGRDLDGDRRAQLQNALDAHTCTPPSHPPKKSWFEVHIPELASCFNEDGRLLC